MSSFRHKHQIIVNAFHLLSVLSLEYCCPIAFWKMPDFYCLWTIASMWILCSVMSKNNWYENFNSLFLWVLITCYHRFVAVHNCIFLYITLGTKPKLAAQWEIIPNKSPINSWWIHASSEKEEDELDWCTRRCFLHGHWRNQVGILVFSEDLRGGFFGLCSLLGAAVLILWLDKDLFSRSVATDCIQAPLLAIKWEEAVTYLIMSDVLDHVLAFQRKQILLPEQFLAEMGNKGRKAELGSPPGSDP